MGAWGIEWNESDDAADKVADYVGAAENAFVKTLAPALKGAASDYEIDKVRIAGSIFVKVADAFNYQYTQEDYTAEVKAIIERVKEASEDSSWYEPEEWVRIATRELTAILKWLEANS